MITIERHFTATPTFLGHTYTIDEPVGNYAVPPELDGVVTFVEGIVGTKQAVTATIGLERDGSTISIVASGSFAENGVDMPFKVTVFSHTIPAWALAVVTIEESMFGPAESITGELSLVEVAA